MTSAATRAVPAPDAGHRNAKGVRGRGRPKLLDRERILATAQDMLADQGPGGFTMNGLAQRLGASVMTLYTYFPSREALLDAIADGIFSGFQSPAEDMAWPDAIRAWLHELDRMFDRHPVGLRLIKWDGVVTPSWLKVWMPLLHILSRAGCEGETLLLASNWVGRVAMALLMVRLTAPDEAASTKTAAEHDPTLSDVDRALLAKIPTVDGDACGAALYAFGADNIVRGLEGILRSPL